MWGYVLYISFLEVKGPVYLLTGYYQHSSERGGTGVSKTCVGDETLLVFSWALVFVRGA